MCDQSLKTAKITAILIFESKKKLAIWSIEKNEAKDVMFLFLKKKHIKGEKDIAPNGLCRLS